MFILNSPGTDPFFNLALEEVLLKKRNEEFIILGRNSRSVIAGKHQCIHREINTEFITGNKIPVIRRITGGGTVYHDEGNLTFAFIRNSEQGRQIDFPRYLKPVFDFLKSLGISAGLSGSDIISDGKKISGNAEHVHRNRVLHHGTILFSADLEMLRNSLRRNTSSYTTRAVASNPSPVMNLSNKITHFENAVEFKSAMADFFMQNEKEAEKFILPPDVMYDSTELANSKYKTWEWTFAYGPEYELSREFLFRGSECFFRFSVKDGIIHDCVISGNELIEQSAPLFRGIRHMPGELQGVLEKNLTGDLDVYNFF